MKRTHHAILSTSATTFSYSSRKRGSRPTLSMAFINPLFPGWSRCSLFLPWRTSSFTDVAGLGTFPFAPISLPHRSLYPCSLPALKWRIYPIIHCEVNCTFTTCYSLQFRTIHVCICWFTGKTLVQANEQKGLSKLIVASGFYVPERAPLQLIERTL